MADFEFADDLRVLPGVVAVALFALFAVVFLGASFPDAAGFAGDARLISGIGYALFDFTSASDAPTEGFLAAFEIIDLVLVGALVGAVMLARRDDGSFGELFRGGEK